MKPSDALRERVLAAAANSPSPTRHQGRRTSAALTVASAVVALLAFSLTGGFEHGAGRPIDITLLVGGGWALGALILTWGVVGRTGSTLARTPSLLAGAAAVAPIGFFAWTQMFFGTYDEPFERIGYRCVALTLLIAATPMAAFIVARRGVEPRRPTWLGAAMGVACGAWAGAVVSVWCPLSEPGHVLRGHIAPLLVLLTIGAIAGGRWFGLSRLSDPHPRLTRVR